MRHVCHVSRRRLGSSPTKTQRGRSDRAAGPGPEECRATTTPNLANLAMGGRTPSEGRRWNDGGGGVSGAGERRGRRDGRGDSCSLAPRRAALDRSDRLAFGLAWSSTRVGPSRARGVVRRPLSVTFVCIVWLRMPQGLSGSTRQRPETESSLSSFPTLHPLCSFSNFGPSCLELFSFASKSFRRVHASASLSRTPHIVVDGDS